MTRITDAPGLYSKVIAVVVTPKQVTTSPAIDTVAPITAFDEITIPLFIPGSSGKLPSTTTFTASTQPMNYLLYFTPSGQAGTATVQQASLSVSSGETVALNDIVKSWFGIGATGESATGTLEIRPQSNAISTSTSSSLANGTSLASASVASSRTYNLSSNGTFGQFIPAIPFSRFVAKGAQLSLQNISQSTQYRTNVGVVEAAGEPATVRFTAYGNDGQKSNGPRVSSRASTASTTASWRSMASRSREVEWKSK